MDVNVGDVVICNTTYFVNLTYMKKYIVEKISLGNSYIIIKNDIGEHTSPSLISSMSNRKYFLTLKEHRDIKIKKLLENGRE